MSRFRGAYTALLTPFRRPGLEVDWERYEALLRFQAEGGIRGVVVGGTTAESPTLWNDELLRLVRRAREALPSRVETIAAVGRNDHRATQELARAAFDLGVRAFMIVDPAYNAPSSLEIRREHLLPIAERFPEVDFLWYAIPARTGTCLSPVDLALAHASAPNLAGLKDACGEERYSREVRRHLPSPFALLSGDDGRAIAMIRDPLIRADGVVSVASNLAPRPIAEAVEAALAGDGAGAPRSARILEALGAFVSFQSEESSPLGPVVVKARNPVPIKASFALLGADVGGCRPPLGRLAPGAFGRLERGLRELDGEDRVLSGPLQDHFGTASGAGPVRAQELWSYAAY